MKTVDKNYFPGWVRKSITFTIDDGHIPTDRKFLEIVKPARIRGTFNLSTPLHHLGSVDYAEFYRGFEIANHCKHHLFPKNKDMERPTKSEPFIRETADPTYAYPAESPGVYYVAVPTGWRLVSWTVDAYMENVDACQQELEDLFGKGSVHDFVWPYGRQDNEELFKRLKSYGFRSIRATENVRESTGFALPADRLRWSYNADHHDLCRLAELYDQYPDDGELKFFSFGVHSVDFEHAGCWEDLEHFCNTMGKRPKNFWYATVGEIFDYEDAVKSLVITEECIINPSSIPLYLKIDGESVIIKPHTTIHI